MHKFKLYFFIAVFFFNFHTQAYADTENANIDIQINKFIDTINTVKSSYAKSISDKKLLEDAIRGMVNNLDPHSEYLDEDAYKALMMSTSGEFGGLGIEVTSQYNVLKIITPMDGTPAAKAGIKPNDFIVAINNKLVSALSSDQAIKEMRGEKGSHVLLTVLRAGSKEALKFDLVRDTIKVVSIKSKLLDNNIGYIRISQFQEPTAESLKHAIEKLQSDTKNNLTGVILDLRNNPGGLLDSAVDVVNLFLDNEKTTNHKKLIVYTQGRMANSEFRGYATGKDMLKSKPLFVLINEGSASASEIVAGALQDYNRAIIVGNTSFGKGSVQTVLPLDETHAIKLTTALYLTPSGRVIQNQGIVPDIFLSRYKLVTDKKAKLISPLNLYQSKSRKDFKQSFDAQTNLLAKEDFMLYETQLLLQSYSHLQKAFSTI